MNYISYLNIFVKYFFINLLTCYIGFKISNFKLLYTKQKLIICSISVILSTLLTFCSIFFHPSCIIMLSYIILSLLFFYITKNKLDCSFFITFLSLSITLILYVVLIFITLLMCTPFPYINKQGPIILAFTILLESLLVFLIFRIKRFKNGFTFFQNKEYNYDLILLLSGIVILIFINLGYYKDNSINHYSLLGLTLILLSMFLWIKEKITLHYKSLLTKDTIENLQNQLDEQISINKNMKNEIDKLSTINHKFSSRINALELHVANLSTKLTSNEDISNNILESKELINRLSTEFSNELKLNLENDFLINKTGIINIDNILDYFYLKCRNKNISFDVIVKTNIKDSVNNAIPLNLLETLIADMITNSIIAIGYSSNNNSSILVQFDSSDYFEFRIYDTGIEFEIDTLINLGKERITTHKEDGGSGIGFFTTFETLNRTNGSLVIEEYPPDNANFNYSKCLIFRFDNNRKYIIRSYRYKEIEKFSYTELITKPLFI